MCRDGHEKMVYIPGGHFIMGNDVDRFVNEGAARTEFIKGFWLDSFLVTNLDFEKFISGHVRSRSSAEGEMPAVDVTWWEALTYCRSLGKRLPSEKEWERASRGPENFLYGYGAEFDPRKANVWPFVGQATRVGSYQPNGFGLYDMSGNIYQFTSDTRRFEEFKLCVVKGGSWGTCRKASRASGRSLADLAGRYDRCGFRCACSD